MVFSNHCFGDVSGVPPGTVATLYLDLLGFGDIDSQVTIDNVFILSDEPIPPIAVDDNVTTDEDEVIAFDVLANDSDLDGSIDPTTVAVVSGSDHGTV